MNRPAPSDPAAFLSDLLMRLRQPPVRDLAMLLYGPAPWETGVELDRALLAGQDGSARLARLDRQPAALLDWLAARRADRLGRYAEALLAFWFTHVPHIELVAANRAVRAGRDTIGEFDFLLRIVGEPFHVETSSKFYLLAGDDPADWVGANLHDAWLIKRAQLQRQLALAADPRARASLPPGFAACRSASLLRGWFFYPASARIHPLHRQAARGWWRPLAADWPHGRSDSRWACLPRMNWLAPARLPWRDSRTEPELRAELLARAADMPQLVAELVRGPDGDGRDDGFEVARGFVMPAGWPDPHRLSLLRERVADAGRTR